MDDQIQAIRAAYIRTTPERSTTCQQVYWLISHASGTVNDTEKETERNLQENVMDTDEWKKVTTMIQGNLTQSQKFYRNSWS